jgi:hypothetical protein
MPVDGQWVSHRDTTHFYLRRQIGLICNDQICDRQDELFEDASVLGLPPRKTTVRFFFCLFVCEVVAVS